jgi:competence protein ComEA
VPDPDPDRPTDLPRPVAPMPWKDRIDLLTQSPSLSPARVASGIAVALVVVLAAWLLLRTPPGPPVDELLPIAGTSGEPASPSSTTSTTSGVVLAHAAGAVQQPGVYRLEAGARVTDLIDAAGGPAPDADLDRLNLAALVADGERVYVPRVGEVVTAADAPSSNETDAPTGPLDLNAATVDQLEELPGIGPATAKAILDERDRRGGFTSVDQLLDVRGIGPAKLDAIRELVTV